MSPDDFQDCQRTRQKNATNSLISMIQNLMLIHTCKKQLIEIKALKTLRNYITFS